MNTPTLNDNAALRATVERAKAGDRTSLEIVVRALQDDVFRLALRMTAHPEDARDASQEILIKIITGLGGFRDKSSIRTWAYRIAVRHMLDRRKSRVEALALDFKRFGADLLDGLAAEPDPDLALAEEVKIGCTLAMLTCLDREHRVAYILAEVFDVAHTEAAHLCGVAEDVYRQRVSRASRTLEAFTLSFCGLVDDAAPCSCPRRVAKAQALGRLQRDKPPMYRRSTALTQATHEMESLHAAARLLRAHSQDPAPEELLELIRATLDELGLRNFGGLERLS